MLASLNAATTAAGAVLPPDFQVSGTACMTGCTRPCTVAFRASAGACYLFGDVSADADIDALVAQATNPAVPQAVIVTEPRTGRLQ